jgi:hypothetical protein
VHDLFKFDISIATVAGDCKKGREDTRNKDGDWDPGDHSSLLGVIRHIVLH